MQVRRPLLRALDSMRARGRCAQTQAPAIAGSSVLGEVPPNRVDKLPVILYRALQPHDMGQVRCPAPNCAAALASGALRYSLGVRADGVWLVTARVGTRTVPANVLCYVRQGCMRVCA